MNPKSVEKINEYIQEILKLSITPISKEDNKLYLEFFEKDQRPLYYANSWFYLTRAANGVGVHDFPLGFKFLNENCLFTIGIFKSPFNGKIHFHIINPLGENLAENIDNLSQKLYKITLTPVYIKKIEKVLFEKLSERGTYYPIKQEKDELSPYAWHKDAPLEDDTFPEIILDIDETLAFVSARTDKPVQRMVRKFKKEVNTIKLENVDSHNEIDSKRLVNEFFQYKEERDIDNSKPEDYYNMIETLPTGMINQRFLKKNIYVDTEPLALVCTEQINNNCHGLYANVCLYQKLNGLSEYAIVTTVERLRDLGIKYLNMGGSEAPGLDKFKRKFIPREKRKSPEVAKSRYWIVYDEK